MERMKELIHKLNSASQSYYQGRGGVPMTDFDFDALYDELLALEKQTGVVYADSPTQRVGFTVLSELVKVVHETKMLSLDKTKDMESLKNFLGNETGLLSWKLDGLTIVLTYENGALQKAVTRGNGEIGEDITHNAVMFKNLPKHIEYNGKLVLRGEAVILFSEFNKLNDTLEEAEKYKNPRNLCAGTVRQLSNEMTAKRNVRFYAFSVVSADSVDFCDSKERRLKWLEALGFSVVDYEIVVVDTIEKSVEQFKEKIKTSDIATDGLVLTFDNISFSEKLGQTSKFPKDSIAFKWEDETAETHLLNIVWSTSRTGLINPVAVFEPVTLEGTTVSRASLHNVSVLEGLKLGIGDTITVYKANMIIPQVAENLTKSATAQIPEACPECGFQTEIAEQNDVKALYCRNALCRAQLVRGLSHFAGRDAMNIEGLSEETIEKFVNMGFINHYADLYKIEKYENEIKEMKGFGAKSYDKLLKSIEKSRNAGLANFIYALGIEHVGLRNAKLLCEHFNNDIMKIINAGKEEYAEIKGFGGAIAHSLHTYLNDERSRQLLLSFIGELKFSEAEKTEDNTLEGMTFVVTGDVFQFDNRKALQEVIERHGGKVTGTVTSKTSFLINNDILSNSSKNAKAKQLNIPIINEDVFLGLLRGQMPNM